MVVQTRLRGHEKMDRREALLLINDWMRMKDENEVVTAAATCFEMQRRDQPAGSLWTMVQIDKLEEDIEEQLQKEQDNANYDANDPFAVQHSEKEKPNPSSNFERDWEVVPMEPMECSFCGSSRLQVAKCSVCLRHVCWMCIDSHRTEDVCAVVPHLAKLKDPARWKFGRGWRKIKSSNIAQKMESGVWHYFEVTDDEKEPDELPSSEEDVKLNFDNPAPM